MSPTRYDLTHPSQRLRRRHTTLASVERSLCVRHRLHLTTRYAFTDERGVAITTDSGATWTFVDPTPADAAGDIWDVVVQPGGPTGQGIVDVCGDDGIFRSTDGGVTWTQGAATAAGLAGGPCSIAVSPDEANVIFLVVGTQVFESDDAGATWAREFNVAVAAQGRIPFVVTNQRSTRRRRVFDLGTATSASSKPAARPSSLVPVPTAKQLEVRSPAPAARPARRRRARTTTRAILVSIRPQPRRLHDDLSSDAALPQHDIDRDVSDPAVRAADEESARDRLLRWRM